MTSQFDGLIAQASAKYGVRADLIAAVIQKESGGNPNAVGDNGAARGLMQMHKAAAQEVGADWADLLNPEKAIDAGTAYLAKMLKLAHGDETLALMAYNQGPGVITRAMSYASAVDPKAPAVTPSHVIATGGLTASLSGALVYLSHWPWQPLTDLQAANFAALLIAGVGAVLSLKKRPFNGTGPSGAPGTTI